MALNINKAVITDHASIDAHTIPQMNVDAVTDQKETEYTNPRFNLDYGRFMRIPKLYSAIIMKAIWVVGKGWTADIATEVMLSNITGNGKETFDDILFNMCVGCLVGRDSYAEIIRHSNMLVNLKILDPSSIKTIFNKAGRIIRYQEVNKSSKVNQTYAPEDILHFSHNRLMGSMHGTSIPEITEEIILADDELFKYQKQIARNQARPFIIWKLKTDDPTKISNWQLKKKQAKENGEDIDIPDDEDLIKYEVVQINPSEFISVFRRDNNNEFYRAVGMPLILFGQAGSTESGGKIEYTGHEQVWEFGQRYVERQIEQQLGLTINLISPASLLESLKADEGKDAQNALNFQQNDVVAGSGK